MGWVLFFVYVFDQLFGYVEFVLVELGIGDGFGQFEFVDVMYFVVLVQGIQDQCVVEWYDYCKMLFGMQYDVGQVDLVVFFEGFV